MLRILRAFCSVFIHSHTNSPALWQNHHARSLPAPAAAAAAGGAGAGPADPGAGASPVSSSNKNCREVVTGEEILLE